MIARAAESISGASAAPSLRPRTGLADLNFPTSLEPVPHRPLHPGGQGIGRVPAGPAGSALRMLLLVQGPGTWQLSSRRLSAC